MPLHQGAHRAIAYEGDAPLSRCNRIGGLINSDMAKVSLKRLSKGHNLMAITNQDRGDEPQIPGLEGTGKGFGRFWGNNGGR